MLYFIVAIATLMAREEKQGYCLCDSGIKAPETSQNKTGFMFISQSGALMISSTEGLL